MYRRFVTAAVHQHTKFCSITRKVHLMFKHVEWQMEHVPGGLGDKMEDWIELAHQAGARLHARFRTVKDPLVRAIARAKASFRESDPAVIAHEDGVNERSKRSFKEKKVLKVFVTKEERQARRLEALDLFERQQNVCTECIDVER